MGAGASAQEGPVDKEKAKALADECGVTWGETYSDQFEDMADEDGVIPADIWNSEIEDMIAARARNEVAAASGAKHVFGWAPENVHVFIAAFNRYEGDAEATWSDADRLDKEMHEYFVSTVGVPEDQAVLLMDGDGTVANATEKLSALCARAKENDLLFIYWGSHGSVSTVGESGYQKDTYQTKAFDGWISGIDFANIIDKNYNGSHVFMGTDTCYSGSMNDIMCEKACENQNFRVATLSSTGCYQTAWSAWRFARCLLRGLRGDGIVRATVGNSDNDGNGGESKGADTAITMEDLATYTQSEMAFLADGHPEFAIEGFAPSSDMVSVATVNTGAHRGDNGDGRWDVGDRVMVDGQRAVIQSLEDGVAVVEMGGRDGGQIKRVDNNDALKAFTWRTFEEGTSVELRWDGWADWHGDANVIESFEHLHLVLWDNPHPEFTAGPAEKWVANSMVRLPGEGGVGGAGVVVAGAGCDTCNGTYDEDGAYKGRPLYTNKETGLQIWWNGQWRLGKTNDYYYQLDAGEALVCGSDMNPWEVSTQSPNAATCEPGPTMHPSALLLSGAGSDEVNGQYLVDGAYKGQALYTNKETGLQIWWNGQWRLGKSNDYYYQLDAGEQSVFGSPGEEDGSWEVATFQPHEGTCGPAPNLSVYSQTCP